jgi:hypothetical protein
LSTARPAAEERNPLAAIGGALRIHCSASGCADLLAFEPLGTTPISREYTTIVAGGAANYPR